jgi:hypothetical protein
VSHPDVLLWALKPAEEGIAQGLVVRPWNLAASARSATPAMGSAITSARSTTHLETNLVAQSLFAGALPMSFAPRQLRTFRITAEVPAGAPGPAPAPPAPGVAPSRPTRARGHVDPCLPLAGARPCESTPILSRMFATWLHGRRAGARLRHPREA